MTTKPKSGKTLADLRAAHDRSVMVPNRIRAAHAALAASGDEWAYEADFRELVKPPIAHNEMPKYRDQFKDFWVELPKTSGKSHAPIAWFVSKKLADEWREKVGG